MWKFPGGNQPLMIRMSKKTSQVPDALGSYLPDGGRKVAKNIFEV